MKHENLAMMIAVIAGALMGFASDYLHGVGVSSLYNFGIAVIGFIATKFIFVLITKPIDKKFKWFLQNSGWLYFFAWFITWIVLYNL